MSDNKIYQSKDLINEAVYNGSDYEASINEVSRVMMQEYNDHRTSGSTKIDLVDARIDCLYKIGSIKIMAMSTKTNKTKTTVVKQHLRKNKG